MFHPPLNIGLNHRPGADNAKLRHTHNPVIPHQHHRTRLTKDRQAREAVRQFARDSVWIGVGRRSRSAYREAISDKFDDYGSTTGTPIASDCGSVSDASYASPPPSPSPSPKAEKPQLRGASQKKKRCPHGRLHHNGQPLDQSKFRLQTLRCPHGFRRVRMCMHWQSKLAPPQYTVHTNFSQFGASREMPGGLGEIESA
ncbi:hypothetical protein MKEN_00534400 [Mycena kentingensis (nom. inval.)]|nr:hypothetical protein MKEN_00534400 [Mycena kentingensis (nom. inval.)]